MKKDKEKTIEEKIIDDQNDSLKEDKEKTKEVEIKDNKEKDKKDKKDKKEKTKEESIELKDNQESLNINDNLKKESVKFRKINFNIYELSEKGHTKMKEEAFKDKTKFLGKSIFWVLIATLSIIFGIVVITDSITKIIDLANDEITVSFFAKIFKSIGVFLEALLFIFYFSFSITKFIDNWKLHLNSKKLFHALFYAETNSLDLYQNDINDIYKSYLIEKRIEKSKNELDKQKKKKEKQDKKIFKTEEQYKDNVNKKSKKKDEDK